MSEAWEPGSRGGVGAGRGDVKAVEEKTPPHPAAPPIGRTQGQGPLGAHGEDPGDMLLETHL